MKIKIALCDNDVKLLSVIAGATESILKDHGFRADIQRFNSGEALLKAMEQTHFEMLLLDIDMPGLDGIAVGKKIREKKYNTQIVYVSEWEGRVFEALMIQPLGFVRKTNFLTDLSAVIGLYANSSAKELNNEHLELITRDSLLTVDIKHVRYFEGSRNYQLLYLDNNAKPIEIKMTMGKLEEITASHGFIRVHKGYLVNYRFIQRIFYDKLVLRDGKEIPVGRSKANDIKSIFLSLLDD